VAAAAAACRGCGLCAARRRGVPRAARARAQCRMRRPLDHVGWMSPRFLRHRAWPSSRSQPLASSCAIRAVECGCHGPPPCPTVLGMRTGPLVLATAVMLALAGCVPSDSPATSEPSASLTPVFASDAEALAAAEAAYAAYQAAVDKVLVDGGSDPGRLQPLVSKRVYADELKGFRLASSKGWRSTGGTTFDHFTLESYTPSDPSEVVIAYVCSDVSSVNVFDASGASVVAESRPDRTPFEVTFALRDGDLTMASNDVWSGGGVC